ncbi:TAXI family TRAP transporter solute-binding subunit [Salininema proteolyticum]|uniref:TAXI family TRAP transporter solute-binding subunit n=1 Tax=Salininema proteolyticum TaxID=1607685 RepID=A0ABV8U1Y4_9ACTN
MLRKAGKITASLALTALVAGTAACGGGNDGDRLEMGSGSTGGDYFSFGAATAEMWSKNTDTRVTSKETGASVDNLTQISEGDLDLGMSINGTATQAAAQEGDFANVEPNFQFVGNFYPEVLHVVAGADAGIETIDDLEGKRVAIGPDGSGTQALAKKILDSAGIEPAQTFADKFGAAGDKIADGQVDAAFGVLSVPSSAISKVTNSTDLTFVEFGDELIQQLLDEDSTLDQMTIEAGTYEGVDEDAVTVTNFASLYASPEVSEDVVYDLVKALYEDTADIDAALSEQVDVENAIKGLKGVEIHPGAKKYFEEQGIL